MTDKNIIKGHIMGFCTILVWGTTFISTKVLLRSFMPAEILFFRFIIGFLTLMVAYPKRLIIKDKKEHKYFMLAGLTGVTLYFLVENFALTFSYASNVGLILCIAPFFTALFVSFFFKDEKLKKNFFIGFISAIFGIVLITFNESKVLNLNPIGDLLAALAAIIWALYSLCIKKITSFGYNTILVTRRVFFFGLLFMLPVLPILNVSFDFSRFSDPLMLFNIVYLGIFASAICFVTWNIALKLLGAIKSSVYIYLSPVITITASIIFLNERITIMAIIGAVFTILGLVLSERNEKKKA